MEDDSEPKRRAADRIIDGLKQAAQCAVCEHDWETESASIWQGKISMTRICPYCGAREHVVKS